MTAIKIHIYAYYLERKLLIVVEEASFDVINHVHDVTQRAPLKNLRVQNSVKNQKDQIRCLGTYRKSLKNKSHKLCVKGGFR